MVIGPTPPGTGVIKDAFFLPHQNQRLRTIFRFHHGSCQRQSQLPRPLPYLQSQILLFPTAATKMSA